MPQKINIVFFIFFFPAILFAQDSTNTPKRIVKANVFGAAFLKASVQGEFLMKKRTSILLGLTYTPERNIEWVSNNIEPFFSDLKFTSFALTPEFRFYLSKKKTRGNGFYLAPYLRYKNSALRTSFAFSDKSGFQLNIPIKYTINSFNLGVMSGYQWIFKNGFSIDWWIAGAHFGTAFSNIGIDISGITNFLNSPEIKNQIDNSLNNSSLPFWVEPMLKSYLRQKNIGFSWVQPNFGLRTGFTIGVAF